MGGLGADAILSIASQASQAHADQMNLAAVSEYIDAWHVMSYDYAVSDLPDGSSTSPNAPLYTPPAASGAVQMSINQTIMHYLARGCPRRRSWSGCRCMHTHGMCRAFREMLGSALV